MMGNSNDRYSKINSQDEDDITESQVSDVTESKGKLRLEIK